MGTPRERPTRAPVAPVKRNGLADQVIESMSKLVARGTYRIGDKLPAESELCDLFGVGRSTLREAMRALANRGIVDVRHGGGTYVIATAPRTSFEERIGRAALAEIYEARLHLELPLAELAAQRRSTADIAAMRNCLEHRERAARAGDVARYTEADFAFHRAVAKAAKNTALAGIYESFAAAVEPLFANAITPEYLRTERDALHAQLCEAIANGDRRQARKVASAHLRGSLAGIGTLL